MGDFDEMEKVLFGNGSSPGVGMNYEGYFSLDGCHIPGLWDEGDGNGSVEVAFPTDFNFSLCNMDGMDFSSNPADFDVLKRTPQATLVIVVYAIVIFLGTVGNSLVVLTVIRTRQMWNATNIFIANLACADVFVCVFDLPLSIYYQLTGDWIFGRALCHVIPAAFGVVIYGSTLTLTLIAIDRYLLIVFPLKRRVSVVTAIILVVLIAVVAVGLASPVAIFSRYVIVDQPDLNLHRRVCMEKWPSERSRRIYTVVTLILQYFAPLSLIAVLYFLIFQRVRMRMKSKNSRKNRTTKMLVSVVAVFAITSIPFNSYSVVSEFNYDLVKGKYFKFTDAMLRVFAMSSSCLNPFLYGWMNDNYRNAFLSLVQRRPKGRIHREESEETTKRSTVAHQSPKKKKTKPLFEGRLKLFDRSSTSVPMTNMKQKGKVNNNVTHHITSPLLEKGVKTDLWIFKKEWKISSEHVSHSYSPTVRGIGLWVPTKDKL